MNLQNKDIQQIKPHTKHKIKLITKYVEHWLEVASNTSFTKSICFIDGMCNAGIYSDGTLGTSTEVLKLFVKFSKIFPKIEYKLFCNDINKKRIEILKEVLKEYVPEYEERKNIKVYINNIDINIYILELLKKEDEFNFSANAFTLLFLDPYNFGTIELNNVMKFLKKYRAELMYNYFISDVRRNSKNEIALNKQSEIIRSMKGLDGYNGTLKSEEIKTIISNNLKNTKTKFLFTYQFRISTNVEIYNIMFASPSIKGIEEFKKVLWDLFNGDDSNYKLLKAEKIKNNQLTFFDNNFIKNANLQRYAEEAQFKLIEKYSNQEVSFLNIKEYLICNTMLKSTDIINNVIKPLIMSGRIEKKNVLGKRNYKNDKYFVK